MHKMQYEPLDKTKNEIRVLEFLNLSSPVLTEDIVQCSVRNVSLPSSFDSQLHQQGSQKRKFPIAWDKFTKSVDLRDSALKQTRLDAVIHAGLHRRYPQCNGSRYDWGDFEALSYAWGNTGETKTIHINGVPKNVPHNLEEALRALQNLEETPCGMCYWVDSLCIDQENIEERNEQVKRMKEIYGRARAVIVWLGSEEEMDRIAVQKMHRGLCEQPHSEQLAFLAFARKPYWNRCWIIQELAMNHNSTLFLCGQFKLTRDMIRNGAYNWPAIWLQPSGDSNHQSDRKLPPDALAMVGHLRHLLELTPNNDIGIGMDSPLALARRADATDGRDKIYSILGLLHPAISTSVTPNYSLSVRQVYTDFMESVINATKRLDNLAFIGVSAEQGWPSWVVDWRKPVQRHYMPFMKSYQASGDVPAKFRFIEKEKNRTYLACSGFHVDTVDGIAAEPPPNSHATLSDTFSDGYSDETLKAITRALGMGCFLNTIERLFRVPWYPPRSIYEEYWKWSTLFQSRDFERWDNFRRYNQDFCIGDQKFRNFFSQLGERDWNLCSALRGMRLALLSLNHRALIATRTSCVGLAPVETRPGDVVAILLGCRWPVVLRPCNDSLYQVIGECYMPGHMRGEILDQQRDGLVSEREFILC